MAAPCTQLDCTVLQTGICLLNNDASDCPNRQSGEGHTVIIKGLAPVLSQPEEEANLPTSLTLSSDAVHRHLRKNLCMQVGVLGFPNAGKTAALVSLYLLLASNMLDGFEYRNSKTLLAFEQISRGARTWDMTDLPKQLTAHTIIADGRTAGFLHLKLLDRVANKYIEFFLPDLPGEWTTALVDENRKDRLAFLAAADVIWHFVNGEQLSDLAARGLAVHRTELAIKRTAALFGDARKPPLVMAVTRRDNGESHRTSIEALEACAASCGFDVRTIDIASFSKHQDETPAGTGLAELIRTLRPVEIEAANILSQQRNYKMRYSQIYRNP